MHDQAERYAADLEGQPEYFRVALAFKALSESNGSLSLLNRYQDRLQREYQRILKTLLDVQAARLKEARNEKLQNEPNPESEHSAADSADAQVLPLAPASDQPC